jgi:hypothetical protein
MSSVLTNRAEMSKRSYIACQDFTGHLWSYATTRSQTTFVVTGSLTAQSGGSYPKGTILHETGKRLFPGANPGVTTMMVGVFNSDVVPALSGFIDPNSKYFTTFSTHKPVTIPNGYDQDDSTNLHSGQPVVTNGVVDAKVFNLATATSLAGTVTLSAGAASVSVPGISASALVFATDRSATAAVRGYPSTGDSTLRFTGTGTDVISYIVINPY